jgi:hypothetical protein
LSKTFFFIVSMFGTDRFYDSRSIIGCGDGVQPGGDVADQKLPDAAVQVEHGILDGERWSKTLVKYGNAEGA